MATKKREMEAQEKKEVQSEGKEPTREGFWFRPLVDIFETEAGITLRCDMPGVGKDGLDIDLREDVLTVTGKVEAAQQARQRIHSEYEVGGFTRQFQVGEAIDQNKITANLSDGVLTVHLPKAEKLKPRKIEVTAI
ncbi:MAG: Hsp20/alpha crystallin family protein [Polyangia bacterium]|jgi:HSP20 family protein|nr:Hsp20/alpha crystallin family protein [Polyangia bacterium]